MKTILRSLAWLACLTLLLGLTGCGAQQPDANDPNSKENAIKTRPGMNGGAKKKGDG